jgi:uncharacterized membrane protein
MQEESQRLQQQIESLTRRVANIEQRLGVPMQELPQRQPSAPAMAPIEPAKSNVPDTKSQAFARLVQPTPAATAPPQRTVDLRPVPPPPSVAQAPVQAPPPRPRPQPPATYSAPPKPAPAINMERLIGGRWYAWIGALAVVIGVGLFVKLAYDQHWLVVPPSWRCAGGAAFGLLLITVGELVRRKINAAAAAGLLAAGVGSIYASVFAAYRLYDLLTPPTALILLAAAATLGILIGARARLVSVSIVSLIGGYLAPFLMDTPNGNPAVLPLFLLMLLAVGLVLSAQLRGLFTILRTLTWWATIIIGGSWVLQTGVHHFELAVMFLGLAWAAIHAELAVLARTDRLIADPETPPQRRGRWKTWRPLTSSFSTTAWAVFLGVNVLDAAKVPDWTVSGALMVATAALWMILAGNLQSLREPPRTDGERLGACLGIQSLGLLIATISLAMGGYGEVICWIALGVTSIVAGKWLRARAFDVYGLIVLTLCAGRLILIDSWSGSMTAGGEHMFGFVLTRWAALMAATGAAWVVMALVLRPSAGKWRAISNTMVGVGIGLLGISLANFDSDVWTFAAIATTAGVGHALASRLLKSSGLAATSVIVLLFATTLIAPTGWWQYLSPRALSMFGLYITPRALILPYVALGWLISPMLFGAGSFLRPARDFGLAACVTLLAAACMHERADQAALAFITLSAALALIALARLRASIGLTMYAGVNLAAGTILVLASRWWQAAGWGDYLGLHFSRGMLVALYAALCWAVTSTLLLRIEVRDREISARVCLALALAMLFGAFVHENGQISSLCLTWLALSLALGAARKFRPALATDAFALVGLAASTVAWILAYAAQWTPTTAPLVLHPGLGVAALLSGAWALATHWCLQGPGRTPSARQALFTLAAIAIGGVVFSSTTLEVARIAASLADDPHVRAAAVSIWWGICAAALVVGGFWKRITPARHIGLSLLALAMAKTLIIDLRGVPPVWRIASFIGLGLLMLGVAVVYSKVSATWDAKEELPASA